MDGELSASRSAPGAPGEHLHGDMTTLHQPDLGATTAPPPRPAAALGGHVASGVRWGLLNQVVQQVTRFAVQLVLTRLLAPGAFGVMAIALVVVNLGSLLAGLGFSQALVQRPEVRRAEVDAALGGSLLLGLVLAGGAVLAAAPIARYFDEPDVVPILRALSVVFVLQSLEGVPNSMLRRDFRFREFVLSSTFAAVVGAATGVVLAVAGAGVWALVGFALCEAAVATGLGWLFATRAGVWRPAISFDLRPLRALLSYSGAVTGTRLIVFGIRNVDNVIVGRVLGTAALGYYGLAYRLMLYPILRVTDVVASVTLPAFSRMEPGSARLGSAFLRAVRMLAAVILPITLGTSVAAPLLVPVLFGDRWSPAIGAVQVLCLSGPALAASRLNGNLFEATGRASWNLLLSVMGLVVLVPAFLVGVDHGLPGVAWAYTVSAYVGVVPTFWFVRRCTDVAIRRQLANLATVLVASAALVGAATVARLAVEPVAGRPLQLVVLVLAGALAYLGVLLVLDRPMLRDMAAQLRDRGAGASVAT